MDQPLADTPRPYGPSSPNAAEVTGTRRITDSPPRCEMWRFGDGPPTRETRGER